MRIGLLVLVAGLELAAAGFQKVAVGQDHFLFLQDDGTVLGFGQCQYGNLAATGCRYVLKPAPIALPGPVVDIAASKWASYAVLADGRVFSWGSDETWMLGRESAGMKRPSTEGSPVPAPIPGLPKVTQVVAALETAAVITESGEVWMWGTIYNDRNSVQVRAETPRRIEGLPPVVSVSIGERSYAGVTHQLAVGRDGSLWAWGFNELGQVGDGTTKAVPAPKRLNLPPVFSAAAGGNNSVAVLADGTVRVWGGNDSSTMGNGQNVQGEAHPVPVPVAGVTGAVAVSAGYGSVAVLLKNGTLRTWGHDGWGQAGIGTSGGYQMRPAAPKLTGVTAVMLRRNNCFALTTGGRLWFWGPGRYWLPGPMRTDKSVPVDITALW